MTEPTNRACVFSYKNTLVDLRRVLVIDANDSEHEITFYFQDDWEWTVEIVEIDKWEQIKKDLVEKFNFSKF